MEKLQPIDIQIFIAIMEGMGAIVVILLGVLGYFLLSERKNTTTRMDKIEEFMADQSAQFLELAKQNSTQIELIKVSQTHESKRLDMLQSMVQANAMEDKILTKLLALQGK